ncbi:MAG: LexA family transcriptional regulator [Candidatus Riflebacteria bacterium]
MQSINERIREIRASKGLSQKDFAERIGAKWHQIKDVETEKTKPSVDLVVKISEIFSINSHWLLHGGGNMLSVQGDSLPVAVPSHPEDDENTVALNYYPDIVAAAGYGGINESGFRPQIMRFDRRFLEQFLNVRRFDRLDIITVFGNSMEPFVSNGETVILERTDDARNGETVIANINGDIYIKRIKKDPLNRWVKFLSDNNEYDEIELKGKDLEHVTIIGIVRAKIRPF